MKTLFQHIRTVQRDYESADRVDRELRIKAEVDKYFQTQGWAELVVKSSKKGGKI